MQDPFNPARVLVRITAVAEDGTELLNVRRTVDMTTIKKADFPVLVDSAAACAMVFEEQLADNF